jgi:hypothetical protein
VCPLSQTGSRHSEMLIAAHMSATRSRELRRAPPVADSDSTLASVADPRGPPRPPLSPPPIKGGQWPKISSPLRHFVPLADVSVAAHSSPVRQQLAWPFTDYFGIGTHHTVALLLPQVSRSSGRSFGLHRASHRRPPPTSVNSCSCASVQWLTVAVGCSEAWRNSQIF